MNNSIHFQNAVETIRRTGSKKGQTITEAEMAGKISLSPEQFQAYKDGKTAVPDGLAETLLGAYGHKLKMMQFRSPEQLRRPGEERD